jgi:RNA-dependent RNA polymerase
VDVAARHADRANNASGILARVRRILRHGLNLAGRHFKFLASSASQLREHGSWFVSGIDAKDIYQWMGVIHETNVAKYASRMGIPFSTTRELKHDDLRRLMTLDDVKVGKYTFTDGAGLCSQAVAVAAAKVLGIKGPGIKAQPSAIQVRIGGAKGILVVSDKLEGFRYQLRESMVKFTTARVEFCAIRVSLRPDCLRLLLTGGQTAAFKRATLNRQYIALFSAHGIADLTFIDMFRNEVKEVQGLPKRFRTNTHDRLKDINLVKSMTTVCTGTVC